MLTNPAIWQSLSPLSNSVKRQFLYYSQLARWHQPTGIWLVLLPCWWGLLLSHPPYFPIKYFLLFLGGAIVMRGAGCTYNDMVDRNLDRHVKRTSQRPLAGGHLHLYQALIFLGLQLFCGLLILLQFPTRTIQWGLASLVLVFAYPWMKRVTYWPQAFLGLTFNWGIVLGWSFYQPFFKLEALLLYLAGFCWTLGYDTIYAHQDRQDDLTIGIKSSALALGNRTQQFLTFNYSILISLLIAVGWLAQLTFLYYVGLIFVALHLTWQVLTLDIYNPQNCHQRFKANVWTGLLILGCFVVSWLQQI